MCLPPAAKPMVFPVDVDASCHVGMGVFLFALVSEQNTTIGIVEVSHGFAFIAVRIFESSMLFRAMSSSLFNSFASKLA